MENHWSSWSPVLEHPLLLWLVALFFLLPSRKAPALGQTMFPGIVLHSWWSRNHLQCGRNTARYKQNNSCHPPSSLLCAMLHFGLHFKKSKPACHCSSSPKPLGLPICNSCKFSTGEAGKGEKEILGYESGVFFHISEYADDLLILMRHAASHREAPCVLKKSIAGAWVSHTLQHFSVTW